MTDHKAHVEPLIPAGQIAARIRDLAPLIDRALHDAEQPLAVVVLRGGFIFAADLLRAMQTQPEVDFIEASSYGMGTESRGTVEILRDIRTEISGRDVLVIEDMVDTGHTLAHVMQMLAARAPRSLRSVVLLDKPARREADVEPDWAAFEIGDVFVQGYGIDHAQRGRTLPFVGHEVSQ